MPDDTLDDDGAAGEMTNPTASLPQDESGFHNQTNMNLQENQAQPGGFQGRDSFEEPGIPYLKQEPSQDPSEDRGEEQYQEQPSISPQAIHQEIEYPGEGDLSATTKKSKQISGYI